MRHWMRAIVTASLLFVGTAASAAKPFYFWQAKVDEAVFLADYGECEELAGGVERQRTTTPYTPNLYAQAAASLFSGFMNARARRDLQESVLRTCMADKGYRRVEVDDATRRELKTLEGDERVARLFALATQDEPSGEVLPL